MANKLLVLLVVLSLCVVVFPHQSVNGWEKSYDGPSHGDDYATAILKDDQGQVYVTGYSWSDETSYDYFTVKYSSIGSTYWESRYDGPAHHDDKALAIARDPSGYIVVTGRSKGGELDYDCLTLRYEPDGDLAEGWPQTYDGPEKGNDEACALALDGGGNIYVTGRSYNGEAGYDYLTINYSRSGDTVWVRRYDGKGHGADEASAVAVDASGNVYVTGRSWGGDSGYDYVTIKYEPNGDIAEGWPVTYDRDGDYDEPHALTLDDSGCVYMTGGSYTDEADYDYLTIRYYPTGEYWARVYDGPAHAKDVAEAIAIDPEGNICVTGTSEGSGSGPDYLTIKYDPDGEEVEGWPQRYDQGGSDEASAVAVDDSGNVYVTGKSYDAASLYDYLTIMYEPGGSIADAWPKIWDGPGEGDDDAVSMAVGLFNYVYITGASDGGSTENDYATIKYVDGYRGDINGDNETDVADVIFLYNYLYRGGEAPEPLKRADVNCDEKIDVGDGVFLNNYLYRGGPPPCE